MLSLHFILKYPLQVRIITHLPTTAALPDAEVVVPKSEVTLSKQPKADHATRLDLKLWSGQSQVQLSLLSAGEDASQSLRV